MQQNPPKTAFILFPSGAFGGAEKRFTNLFIYLSNSYKDKFHFIVNPHMERNLLRIFRDLSFNNLHVINTGESTITNDTKPGSPSEYRDIVPDMLELDKNTSRLRKLYWYQKNKIKQRNIFRQIEKIRSQNDIKVLIGIFAGGLPLVFYKENNFNDVKIIFSDMDSWFSDILPDKKRLWYRKYYSFNYIMESADRVDFLSPYIVDGVSRLGVKIKDEKISVAPCSFADYSKCSPGNKDEFEVAFAGRLEPDKNPLMYLEAAREILKIFPGVKFHLLGEGSLVKEINNYIAENKLKDNVNFTFHNNPPEIFSRTSVFVSLQTGTNYPSQSVLEAMACGNAVIASNVGDTAMFINKDNGVLTGLNAGSVIESLKQLIDNRQKTKIMGSNARNYVLKNHTAEKVTEYYISLINKTCGEGYIG